METSYLVLLIISLFLLLAHSFFIFQIWMQSKETKLQLTIFLQELQRSFVIADNNLMKADMEIKKAKDEITEHINNVNDRFNTKHIESIEILKTNTINRVGELMESTKALKEQLENRMKEMEKHLTVTLIDDLTHLTENYSEKLNEKHLSTLIEFSKTSNYIKNEHERLYKAITEPLNINTNNND